MISVSLHSLTSNAYGRDSRSKKQVKAHAERVNNARQLGLFDVPVFAFNGFITCSQSDTKDLSLFRKPTTSERLDRFDRQSRFFALRRSLMGDDAQRVRFVCDTRLEMSSHVGFKLREFRSGEMTGAEYMTGRQYKVIPPPRSGGIETTELTQKAKTKIRRSVECSETALKYFCTLTFAPALLHSWELNEDGTVRHDFAKWKIRKFLKACRMQQSRLNRELNYVWVAEIQGEKTNNIHFHIIWDQFFNIKWLSKIWGQASNSVDIKTLKNVDHAANYMSKYLSKGKDQTVKGNRYFIAHKLHKDMEPKERVVFEMTRKDNEEMRGESMRECRELLQAMKEDIELAGGKVGFCGFHVSRPRSSRRYKDKKTGEEKETRAIDARLPRRIHALFNSVNTGSLPF